MDTKLSLVGFWFGLSYTTFIFASVFLVYLTTPQYVKPSSLHLISYNALPAAHYKISDEVKFRDGRARIVEQFFNNYKSALAKYADLFVSVADERQLDWRLLPAIAMQESNGGKRVITNSYNPFGYGIWGEKVTKFTSWESSIKTVASGLKSNYYDLGLKTPAQIMTKYTPQSLAKDGAWAKGVNFFIAQLR